jgi:hypothetical protein
VRGGQLPASGGSRGHSFGGRGDLVQRLQKSSAEVKMKLYEPFPSSAKHKKYSVYVMKDGKRRLIHFGDARYGQFKDKLGHYSDRDHNDKARRASYYKRHGPATDKNTAKYWSHKILW